MALTFRYGKDNRKNVYVLPKRPKRHPPSPPSGDGKEPYRYGMGAEFYDTRVWRELRWTVLHASDGRCKSCGASAKTGAVMQVDHIKPRSLFPELELSFSNLQVMCEDCNLGKGATIWQP